MIGIIKIISFTNSLKIFKDFSPYDPSYVVICTLESIDSIKLLKRTPQHIFVEMYSGLHNYNIV
ncbi:hypothetical protein Avbf_11076 [Armadillidium vulgare]|nr:hypothetical protein Avbf_11076 [Armadillidium vulgare]